MTGMTASLVAALLASLLALAVKLVILHKIGAAPYGSDTYFYLGYTDQIRRNGHRVPRNVDFLFGGTGIGWAVPSFLPWLFSFTSREWLDRNHAFVPIGAKIATVFVLSLCTGYVASFTLQPIDAALAAFAAGVIYALSPINWNANPSNLSDFTYSPRALATFFSVGAGLVAALAAVHDDWMLTAMAIVAVAASVLTAKFSAQVCALILPLVTLLTGDVTYAVVTLLGFIGAIVVSRGHIWGSLVTQFRHLSFYARELIHHRTKHRSPFQNLDFVRLLLFLFQRRWKNLRDLCLSNIVFRGLLLYPVHLVLAVVLVIDWMTGAVFLGRLTEAMQAMLWLWLCSLFVFMLTSLRPLLFLGEADRYLDYLGFAPASLLLALWLVETHVWASVMALGVVVGLNRLTVQISPPPRQTPDPAMQELCAALSARCALGARLLPIPITLSFELHCKTNLQCFFPLPLDETSLSVIRRYPVPIMDLEMMRNKFGVTHVVSQLTFEKRESEVAEAVKGLACFFENGVYRAYELPSLPANHEVTEKANV